LINLHLHSMVPLQVDLLFIASQRNYDGSLIHILTAP
jgi:hypothetical protein